jgi:glycosyltransferase involved in cell wall biosynthesis
MLNKSSMWQKMTRQQYPINHPTTYSTQPSHPPYQAHMGQAYMGRTLIEELKQAASLVDFKEMLNRSATLARFTKSSSNTLLLLDDLKSMAKDDALATFLAIESVSEIQHEGANPILIDCLSHPDSSVRRQAISKLANRRPIAAALPLLLQQLCIGGIDTMHAHQTLAHWASSEPELIYQWLSNTFLAHGDAAVRARLVDLLGILSAVEVNETLYKLAADTSESVSVRIAAISSMGCRPGPFDSLLTHLSKQDNHIGAYATLAINDQQILQHAQNTPHTLPTATSGGLRVCQLVLAKVDKTLSSGGYGETGGVASLLVSLGDALARQPDIDQVLTIGLGSIDDAISSLSAPDNTSQPYRIIAAGDDLRPMNSTNAWEHLPVLKRAIKRCLGNFGATDLIHLRMLDAGTFAAAQVANTLALPICFSFAPDPQNTMQSLQAGGQLNRHAFLDADAQSNLWFRARMLENMARSVAQLALFPQPKCKLLLQDIRKDLRQHSQHKQQSATIAEGIDINLIRQAESHYTGTAANDTNSSNSRGVISDLIDSICTSRRHLPILLSVGRFHPVKGMARIAAAWAGDPLLYNAYNLVLVGGNLSHPSDVEKTVMDAIELCVPINDHRRAGLIMLGGRPRADIAQIMVATMMGRCEHWAAGGIYVDGALKEEFGLALIEALATGLVVVAPSTGGPSTYVDHGDTGILVDPDHDLGRAIHQGFALVKRPGRSLKARNMVEQHYAIDTMAEKLTALYLTVRDKS